MNKELRDQIYNYFMEVCNSDEITDDRIYEFVKDEYSKRVSYKFYTYEFDDKIRYSAMIAACRENKTLYTEEAIRERRKNIKNVLDDDLAEKLFDMKFIYSDEVDDIMPLILGGANLNHVSLVNNKSLLRHALECLCSKFVECLVSYGAALELSDTEVNKILERVIRKNLYSDLLLLWSAGIDINKVSIDEHFNPDHKIDFKSIYPDNFKYIYHSINVFDITEFIKGKRREVVNVTEDNLSLEEELMATLKVKKYKKPDLDKVRSLIEKGVNVNYRNEEKGDFPLLVCARKNYLDVYKLLIENGADVNLVNNYLTSAVMGAARHGNLEILEDLIKNKANINLKCKDGDTALMSAKRHRQIKSFDMLIEAGAYLNQTNNRGETVLDIVPEDNEKFDLTMFNKKQLEVIKSSDDLFDEAMAFFDKTLNDMSEINDGKVIQK